MYAAFKTSKALKKTEANDANAHMENAILSSSDAQCIKKY